MAFLLTILLLLVSVVFRAAIQYRNTGDFGIRRLKQSSSLQLKVATVGLYLVLFGVVFVSLADFLGWIAPQFSITVFDRQMGIVICCSALLLTFISQLQMGKSWRIGVDESEKTSLITHGIYAYIRNPIYSAVLLFSLGLVFLVMHWSSILMMILGYFGIDYLIRKVEEPYLEQLHKDSYLEYKKKAGRYLPFF